MLKTTLAAFGQPDPRISLCVTFSCGGCVRDKVFVPPLPANIDEIKDRITAAINTPDRGMLKRIWKEFSYRLDLVRAFGGGYIEHL